ncbi:MAG: DUF4139 domain-containing protein, partial [Bacteroidetes bacterium]|nr:DUF4139 domain-containing protein [Bacteroidota bacterium]
TTINKGQNILRFYGISQYINQSSIQLEAQGDYIIQSIAFKYDYLKPIAANPRVKILQDSVKLLNELRGENNAIKAAYEEEMAFIQNNRTIGNQQVNSQSDEFSKMAQLIRERTKEVRLAIHKHLLKEFEVVAQINKLNQQINEINGFAPQRTGIIEVTILAEEKITGNFKINYLVNGASWVPTYDLRFEDVDQPIELKYNAKVRQNTGIDWKDATLTLSTSTPKLGNTPPTLHPWSLFYQNHYAKRQAYGSYDDKMEKETMDSSFEPGFTEALTAANFSTRLETMISQDFEIDLAYTILSDNKENLINLRKEKLDANYKYLAIPKLDKEAFLTAEITDWYNLNLLPGTSNMFIGNTYMGQSYINPGIANDTMTLGFGRDKMVKIERKLTNRSCKQGLIAGKQKHEIAYEITVRNLHGNAIELELLDQIPITTQKDIEIELVTKTGAKFDETTGRLTWMINIDSGKTESRKMAFTVKHPRNQTINPLVM